MRKGADSLPQNDQSGRCQGPIAQVGGLFRVYENSCPTRRPLAPEAAEVAGLAGTTRNEQTHERAPAQCLPAHAKNPNIKLKYNNREARE